jgi:hypothetical protein
MESFSFLDVDGKCWASRCGIAGVLGLVRWWAVIEQDDYTVVVALVEHLAGIEHALAGGNALVLVDNHFHVTAAP